jgi:cell division protein FtsZ
VLYQAVKGISDLITQNGIVNVDFADVKTVMSAMGRALMGTGVAKGANRARLAAEMAVTSPLLDDISVEGATGVLINIVGGPDLKMREIQEAASLVQEQAHEDANIIFGASIDETLGENVKVTVIATGFDGVEREVSLEVPALRSSALPQSLGSGHSHLRSAPGLASARSQSDAAAMAGARRPPPPPSAFMRANERPDPRAQAVPSQPRPAPRAPSTQDAFPALDHDWDVPAFQRKGR